jgi:hypothetical protein
MADDAKAQEQKEALASMKNAQANMMKALTRINVLESNLTSAVARLEEAAKQIPESSYQYKSERTHRDYFLACAAEFRKAL